MILSQIVCFIDLTTVLIKGEQVDEIIKLSKKIIFPYLPVKSQQKNN